MSPAGIALLLPEVIRAHAGERSVLAALLDAMAALHAPSERVLDELDAWFDPRRTPEAFVPLLARWVDLERLFVRSAVHAAAPTPGDVISTGSGCLRELVARAAELSQWRGTRRGLVAFLETATGVRGFDVDERAAGADGRIRPFHIRVVVPAGLLPHRALIERIVALEKPAHVTHEVAHADEHTKENASHGAPV